MADRVGSLSPGTSADAIVADPAARNFAPRDDWPDQLVLNGRPGKLTDVFVAGRGLERSGRLCCLDTAVAAQEAEDAAARRAPR